MFLYEINAPWFSSMPIFTDVQNHSVNSNKKVLFCPFLKLPVWMLVIETEGSPKYWQVFKLKTKLTLILCPSMLNIARTFCLYSQVWIRFIVMYAHFNMCTYIFLNSWAKLSSVCGVSKQMYWVPGTQYATIAFSIVVVPLL